MDQMWFLLITDHWVSSHCRLFKQASQILTWELRSSPPSLWNKVYLLQSLVVHCAPCESSHYRWCLPFLHLEHIWPINGCQSLSSPVLDVLCLNISLILEWNFFLINGMTRRRLKHKILLGGHHKSWFSGVSLIQSNLILKQMAKICKYAFLSSYGSTGLYFR